MGEPRAGGATAGRPGVCRSCGAITGAGEASCHVCGAAAGAGAPPQHRQPPPAEPGYDADTVSFARAVLTRPATFTFVFLAANVFVFLLMHLAGGTENPDVLRAYGARYTSLIGEGEWWRIVTPVFVHMGWLHLFVNMYSLFMLGPYVERLYGSTRFVFFWVATGVAGSVASYFASMVPAQPGPLGSFLFRGIDGPSAGASGALSGLVGVLFVFGIRFRHELPEGFKRAFGTGMLPTILINLAIGYTIPNVGNAAHIGGFVAGALLALVVGYAPPGQAPPAAFAWRAVQVGALALVAVSFGEVARHFDGPAPSLERAVERQSDATPPAAVGYVNALNVGQVAFARAIAQGDTGSIDEALAALERAPRLSRESDALRDDLKELLARARDYAPVGRKERQTPEEIARGKQLLEDVKAWNERYGAWVGAEGRNYNLTLREPTAPAAEREGAGQQPPQGERPEARDETRRGGEKK